MPESRAERCICACCQYFRSAIVEKDVLAEQDWGMCAIRSSQTAEYFSPDAPVTLKTVRCQVNLSICVGFIRKHLPSYELARKDVR